MIKIQRVFGTVQGFFLHLHQSPSNLSNDNCISIAMFPISGEKLDREDVDVLIKECCDAEDDDGFIPYEREILSLY